MSDINSRLLEAKYDDIPEFSLQGITTVGKLVDIYDGDTCKIILIHKNDLMKFNCRLKFLDTPEMKPPKDKQNRDEEIKNAIKCRNRLIQLTTTCNCLLEETKTKAQIKKMLEKNNKIVTVKCHEFDKYGRLLVELITDTEKTINNLLIEENFAKYYDGGTKDVFIY